MITSNGIPESVEFYGIPSKRRCFQSGQSSLEVVAPLSKIVKRRARCIFEHRGRYRRTERRRRRVEDTLDSPDPEFLIFSCPLVFHFRGRVLCLSFTNRVWN